MHKLGYPVVVTSPYKIETFDIVSKYIDFYNRKYGNTVIIPSQNIEAMLEKILITLQMVNIPTENKEIKTIFTDLFDYYSRQNSLIYFQNAKSSNYILRKLKYFLTDKYSVKILISSRDGDWDNNKFFIVNLQDKLQTSLETNYFQNRTYENRKILNSYQILPARNLSFPEVSRMLQKKKNGVPQGDRENNSNGNSGIKWFRSLFGL